MRWRPHLGPERWQAGAGRESSWPTQSPFSLSLSLATRMREQRTPCRSNEPRCLLSASPTQLDSPGNLERATRAPLRHTPLTPMVTTTTTLCKYKYKKYKFTGKNYNDKKHKYKYKTRHPSPQCHTTAPMVTTSTTLCKYKYKHEKTNAKIQIKYKHSIIPNICHESHEYTRVNFFWPV